MSIKGTSSRYGAVAIALHWASAAAVLALFGLGFASANAPDNARRAALLGLHAPLGLLVFALTLARAAWALLGRRPAPLAGPPRWQRRTARAVHALLYGLLLAMGASGAALVALSGAAPGPLPDPWRHPPMRAHLAGALLLLALVGVHVAAALHHQFVRRDGVLARIGIGRAPPAGTGALPACGRRAVAAGAGGSEGGSPLRTGACFARTRRRAMTG